MSARFDELLASLALESDLERTIVADPEWQEGAAWGKPRSGHPEGMVLAHVLDVLANVDRVALDAGDRGRLRLIALIHDTFKHRVNRLRPRTGDNHHATIARRFAERHVDDPAVLDVIELHDEAHNAWTMGRRKPRRAGAARARAERLVTRLGPNLDLFLRFYRADNATAGKTPGGVEWFEAIARG